MKTKTTVGMLLVLALAAGVARAAEGPVGQWDLDVAWPQGPAKVLLTVTNTDAGLTVTWRGPQGQLTGLNPGFADGMLTFTLTLQIQGGGTIDMKYSGTIDGDAIQGKLIAPQGREITASGKRHEAG
jgi:hypothetical protein